MDDLKQLLARVEEIRAVVDSGWKLQRYQAEDLLAAIDALTVLVGRLAEVLATSRPDEANNIVDVVLLLAEAAAVVGREEADRE